METILLSAFGIPRVGHRILSRALAEVMIPALHDLGLNHCQVETGRFGALFLGRHLKESFKEHLSFRPDHREESQEKNPPRSTTGPYAEKPSILVIASGELDKADFEHALRRAENCLMAFCDVFGMRPFARVSGEAETVLSDDVVSRLTREGKLVSEHEESTETSLSEMFSGIDFRSFQREGGNDGI